MDATLSATELAQLLGTDDEPFLLDVRTPDEVAAWAIPGGTNIPLNELPERLWELPKDRRIVTLCASGNRSAAAAALLGDAGFHVADLTGGMAAWSQVYDDVSLELPGAELVQVRRRAKGCLSYLLGAGGEAFVIDPSADVDVYLEIARKRGWKVARVFDTHLHADHLSGARALAETTGATLHLNPADPFDFEFVPLSDGDSFTLPGGAALSVSVLHTPGHTEGSTIYQLPGAVLSGDTLFVDSVGRPDLAERAEAFSHNLYSSLRQRVLSLPDDTLILPAHFSERIRVAPGSLVGARLGVLKRELEALSLDEDDFVAWATANLAERPPNYRAIVAVNRGSAPLTEEARHLEAGPNRCSA